MDRVLAQNSVLVSTIKGWGGVVFSLCFFYLVFFGENIKRIHTFLVYGCYAPNGKQKHRSDVGIDFCMVVDSACVCFCAKKQAFEWWAHTHCFLCTKFSSVCFCILVLFCIK